MPVFDDDDATTATATATATTTATATPSPVEQPESSASTQPRRDKGKGRALCPQFKLPQEYVTTLSASASQSGPSSQAGRGLMSRSYTVPPRPRPGRKPATDEPESKRKAQNRASQRSFRARKQKTAQDLTERLAKSEHDRKEQNNAHLHTIAQLREQLQQALDEVTMYREEIERMRQERSHAVLQPDMRFYGSGPRFYPLGDARHDGPLRSSFGSADGYTPELTGSEPECARCRPDYCACHAEMTNGTPFGSDAPGAMDSVSMTGVLRGGSGDEDPDEDKEYDELETDFTAKMTTTDLTKAPDCGFCGGDKDVCVCIDPSVRPVGDDDVVLLPRASRSSAQDVKPTVAMTGPGSCADCQTNPQQRAWCQRVAQLRNEATPPPSSRRSSSKSSSLDIMEPKVFTSIDLNEGRSAAVVSTPTVGCRDAFKLLDGRVSTDPNAMDWRQLKPVPHTFTHLETRRDTFTMEPGMYSAMELDASSILTTLQHAQRPLQPRPSDGTHARLVKEAEERRQASFSPRTAADDDAMLDAVSQYNIGN
ncbi:hypothetical protein BDW02DRAFT_589186 [Decorospora gaudefroyi]|uniref:BZIP domain-containing protein n=1 Tax=Decorospora gaudefroyi TaxID=184978 RepID=A0A6A5KCS5_9PLEO|nr:hypothetical protein BDW02DRAFT_589186 [Decorospora gaudefroyi]